MGVSARRVATLVAGAAMGAAITLPVSALATSEPSSSGSPPGMDGMHQRMMGDESETMNDGGGMMGGGDMMGMHQRMMRMMRDNPEMVAMCDRMMDKYQRD